MLKKYDEMRKVDVTPYTEERDKASYLNWAKCIDLLHDNGAETVYFIPLTNENGSSLFMSDIIFKDKNGMENRCYEVRIKVVIDDKEFEFQSPVMNGANPVKDNSMSQQRVWNSQTRAFVKAVAIHTGLGFDLWLKEEQSIKEEENLDKHDIMKIKERISQLLTEKMRKTDLSVDEISKKIGLMDEDALKTYLKYYKILDNIEKNLRML